MGPTTYFWTVPIIGHWFGTWLDLAWQVVEATGASWAKSIAIAFSKAQGSQDRRSSSISFSARLWVGVDAARVMWQAAKATGDTAAVELPEKVGFRTRYCSGAENRSRRTLTKETGDLSRERHPVRRSKPGIRLRRWRAKMMRTRWAAKALEISMAQPGRSILRCRLDPFLDTVMEVTKTLLMNLNAKARARTQSNLSRCRTAVHPIKSRPEWLRTKMATMRVWMSKWRRRKIAIALATSRNDRDPFLDVAIELTSILFTNWRTSLAAGLRKNAGRMSSVHAAVLDAGNCVGTNRESLSVHSKDGEPANNDPSEKPRQAHPNGHLIRNKQVIASWLIARVEAARISMLQWKAERATKDPRPGPWLDSGSMHDRIDPCVRVVLEVVAIVLVDRMIELAEPRQATVTRPVDPETVGATAVVTGQDRHGESEDATHGHRDVPVVPRSKGAASADETDDLSAFASSQSSSTRDASSGTDSESGDEHLVDEENAEGYDGDSVSGNVGGQRAGRPPWPVSSSWRLRKEALDVLKRKLRLARGTGSSSESNRQRKMTPPSLILKAKINSMKQRIIKSQIEMIMIVMEHLSEAFVASYDDAV